MIAPIVLLDPHAALLIRTLLRGMLDLLRTRVVLSFALSLRSGVILSASLAVVECHVMYRAELVVAGVAAEDVPTDMNLARRASRVQAIAEVGIGPEETKSAELGIPITRRSV